MAGMRRTKDQQWKLVIQGLAAGCLVEGHDRLPGAKMRVEFAFSHAWRRWEDAYRFPSVDPNDFFIYARKSERRNGAAAALGWGSELEPYLAGGCADWEPTEVLDLLSERDAPDEESWVALAKLFVSDLTKS